MQYFASMKTSNLFLLLISFLVLSFFCHGCAPATSPFGWLKGTWEMIRSAGGTRLEIWIPYQEKSLAGRGLMLNENDTTMLEQILIQYRDPDYFYIATIPDQNNGNPIEFKLVKTQGTTYTFENPKHDFPQRIVYQFKPIAEQENSDLIHADSLLVRVETMDGNGIDYGFSRK